MLTFNKLSCPNENKTIPKINRFNQYRKCMYRSNHRIDMVILHALSGSFKSKKYVFIYPNNLMQTWTVWHISM